MPTQQYKLKDGTRVSGVTTIIGNLGWSSRALMHWAWNEGKEGRDYKATSKEACDAGTIAHAMIEADLKEIKYTPPEINKEILEKAETAYLAWLEWKTLVNFELLGSEMPLVSEVYGFGGTIDAAIIQNKTAILDLKTSGATYPDHLVQIAAYGKLYEECYNKPVEAYYLLRLGKEDGSFHYSYWPELNDAWTVFLNCLTLHKLQKTLKKKV